MVLKRNAIDARPLTLAERSALVTCPMIVVPVGSAWCPSAITGARSVARTESSRLLVSDATAVASVADNVVPAAPAGGSVGKIVVPAGTVSSRNSGTFAGGAIASSLGVGAGGAPGAGGA